MARDDDQCALWANFWGQSTWVRSCTLLIKHGIGKSQFAMVKHLQIKNCGLPFLKTKAQKLDRNHRTSHWDSKETTCGTIATAGHQYLHACWSQTSTENGVWLWHNPIQLMITDTQEQGQSNMNCETLFLSSTRFRCCATGASSQPCSTVRQWKTKTLRIIAHPLVWPVGTRLSSENVST